MSKELLENLLIEFDEMGFEPTILCDSKKEIDSFRNRLKQVLDYFKSIDNANPSEALKWLEHTGEQWAEQGLNDDVVQYKETQSYREIKQALLKSQEQEKVLEIIKKKNVNVNKLKDMIIFEKENALNKYNEKTYLYDKLTQEEFDLLKRWLG